MPNGSWTSFSVWTGFSRFASSHDGTLPRNHPPPQPPSGPAACRPVAGAAQAGLVGRRVVRRVRHAVGQRQRRCRRGRSRGPRRGARGGAGGRRMPLRGPAGRGAGSLSRSDRTLSIGPRGKRAWTFRRWTSSHVWRRRVGGIRCPRLGDGRATASTCRRLAVEFEVRANPIWPMPGLLPALEGLRHAGRTLGVISNAQFYTPEAFPALLEQTLAELGFERDLQFYSYQHGRAKPSLELYRLAAAALQRTRDSGGARPGCRQRHAE